ncbi:MAG: hypothetical protein ACMG6E_10755, partial [Candidatus Roizmanbacteria bacterium]
MKRKSLFLIVVSTVFSTGTYLFFEPTLKSGVFDIPSFFLQLLYFSIVYHFIVHKFAVEDKRFNQKILVGWIILSGIILGICSPFVSFYIPHLFIGYSGVILWNMFLATIFNYLDGASKKLWPKVVLSLIFILMLALFSEGTKGIVFFPTYYLYKMACGLVPMHFILYILLFYYLTVWGALKKSRNIWVVSAILFFIIPYIPLGQSLDFTKNHIYSLSKETRQTISKLKTPTAITFVVSSDTPT